MKILTFFGLLLPLQQAVSQTFADALKQYQAGQKDQAYRTALNVFLEDREPENNTAALLLLSQIAYQYTDYRDAHQYAATLVDRFGESRHRGAGRLLAARSAFYLGDYVETVRQLMAEAGNATQNKSLREAEILKTELYRNAIPYPHLRILADSLEDAAIPIALAERLLDHGRPGEAIALLRSIPAREKKIQRHIQDVLDRAKSVEPTPVKVAIIVSLSGPMSDVGRHILEGTTLAFREFNRNNNPAIELLTFDDQSDIVRSVQAAQAIAEADDIALVIGPAESQMMAAAAAIFQKARIPVISPTATKSGLTDIGSFVYQANTPLLDRTDQLATYVTERLKFKTFAILAPSDPYGESAANRFADVIQKKGGRIVANERFYDNTVDFRAQLLQIRKRGLLDRIHRNAATMSLKQIDSLYNVYYPAAEEDGQDHATPLQLDAIFLPIYTDDIKYIAPQMAFYNIQATFLGEDSWVDLNELRLHQPYVKGAIMVSEYFIDPGREDVKAFNRRYAQMFGRDPSKESYYGYDLAQVITSLVADGATTSDRMARALRQGIQKKGLHNDITLSPRHGANSSIHILQFKDGALHRLQ